MDKNIIGKRQQLSSTNNLIFILVAVSVFIVVFVIFAARNLISQSAYQNRVITAKQKALDNLDSDLTAISSLKTSYSAFVNQPLNLIGGNPSGTGAKDGNNSKILLDALPSTGDPNIWTLNIVNLNSLFSQGSDFLTISASNGPVTAPVASQTSKPAGSSMTTTIQPYSPTNQTIVINGKFATQIANVNSIFKLLNTSIIPIQINQMTFTAASDSNSPGNFTFTGNVFYRHEYVFQIGSEDVK